MTKYTVSDKPLLDHATEGYMYLVPENFSFAKNFADVAKIYFPELEAFMKSREFTGKKGQLFSIPVIQNKKVKHIFFVGIGKKEGKHFVLETYRRAIASGVRAAEHHKVESLAVESTYNKADFGYEADFIAQQTVTLAMMASYQFDEFVTDKSAKACPLKEFVYVVSKKEIKAAQEGFEKGKIVGEVVNRTRYWVDLPANKLAPIDIAKRAKELAKKHGLKITVFDEDQIEKMGMGGLKAVGKGSQHDAHLVIMEYNCKKKNAPTLALVGKGITFDSGGLNLKPTGYMETMKEDMSGAAAVINAIVALSEFKPEVNVVALAPLAENMIGGSANHPGDIITFYNGKTAVVGNTDAEGRLILADALAYADKHYKPTAIVDVATLTGACSHAVGPFFSGLLSQDENLVEKLQAAAITSGDALWRLPLIDAYKVMVKNSLADLCNDGKTKYYAGATNGACFLSHFVGETPWAHIDIAPAAFDVPDTPYYRPNMGTGAGTRLLIDFVMNWKA